MFDKSMYLMGLPFSDYFHLSNGVKQGEIISAQLFTVYIDKLFLDLKHSGYGCHLGDTNMGVLSYVDDIKLICPSLRVMNCMLKICSNFAKKFSLLFNSNNFNKFVSLNLEKMLMIRKSYAC